MAVLAQDDLKVDGFPSGPGIGDTLPDFTLPDQRGRLLHYSEWRSDGQALIIFYRSASW